MEILMPAAVSSLLERLERAGHEAWIVGGCVRDSLMGRAPHDWDVATSARPEEMMALFPEAIPTGAAHGTVTVPTAAGSVEMTAYREERGYADHRRPDAVRFVRRIDRDLARRDFTVNAMAWHPERGLLDPFDGQGSLRRREIRCVGDPARRFSEDALRMLRALRFAARLDFAIEPATASAMIGHAPELRYVSPERIYAELQGLLAAEGAALGEAYPALLAAAAARVRLPESRHAMRTWRRQLGDGHAATLLRWCERYGGQSVRQAQALLVQLRREDGQVRLAIDGRTLTALGQPPGPAMGALLRRLRDAVLRGEVANEPEPLAALARRWIAE